MSHNQSESGGNKGKEKKDGLLKKQLSEAAGVFLKEQQHFKWVQKVCMIHIGSNIDVTKHTKKVWEHAHLIPRLFFNCICFFLNLYFVSTAVTAVSHSMLNSPHRVEGCPQRYQHLKISDRQGNNVLRR